MAQIARSAIISILYVEFLFLFLFLCLWLMRIIFRANSLSQRTFKADKNWGENLASKNYFFIDDIHIREIPILRRIQIYNSYPCGLTWRDTTIKNVLLIDRFFQYYEIHRLLRNVSLHTNSTMVRYCGNAFVDVLEMYWESMQIQWEMPLWA